MRLVLYAAPRTKKNHGRIITGNRPRILPSKQHENWFNKVLGQAIQARVNWANDSRARGAPVRFPIDMPVNVAAIFYRDANRGDAVGYYQALGDLLERSGILKNDVLIVSWDGSRLRKDAREPRIEVELVPVPEREDP